MQTRVPEPRSNAAVTPAQGTFAGAVSRSPMRRWIAASLLVVWSLMTVTALADAEPGLQAQADPLPACIDGPSPPNELPDAILSQAPEVVPRQVVATTAPPISGARLAQRRHGHPSARAPPPAGC